MKNKRVKHILAFILIAAQLFTQVSISVIAEDNVSEEPPIVEETVVEEPVVEEPIVEEPVVEEPIVEEPMVEETTIEEPIVEESIVEESIVEEPIAEEPIAEELTVIENQESVENPIVEETQNNIIDNSNEQGTQTEEVVAVYTVKVIDNVTSEVISESELEENTEFDLSSVIVIEHEGYTFDGFYVADTKIENSYVVIENIDIIAKYTEILAETTEKEETVEQEILAEEVVFPEFSETQGAVGISASEGILPEGTVINTEKIDDTTVVYESLLEELNNDMSLVSEDTFAEVTGLKVFDITLDNNGVSVQPNGDVSVTIDFEIKESKQYFAYYVNGSAPERLNSEVVESGVRFTTNHFSTYAIAEVELMNTLTENEDATLLAVPFYNITFETVGGTAIETQEVSLNGKVIEPTAPTKENYEFGGWYTESTCQNEYDFNTPVTEDLTLYAMWNRVYTVSFDVGDYGASAVAAQKVQIREYATNPGYIGSNDSNYVFAGWYTVTGLWTSIPFDFESTQITEDTVLYAKWVNLSACVEVYFDIVGEASGHIHVNEDGTDVIYVPKNGYIQKPETPSISMNYPWFCDDIWRIDSPDGLEWDFNNDKVTGNLTLYANSKRGIEVDLNNGNTTLWVKDGAMIEEFEPTTEIAFIGWKVVGLDQICDEYGNSITESIYGYEDTLFDERYIDFKEKSLSDNINRILIDCGVGDSNYDGILDVTPDMCKLYLVEAYENTTNWVVSFDSNGGSTVLSQNVTDGEKIDCPNVSKEGYIFKGWYTDNDSFQNEWDFENDTVDSSITLYAKWEPLIYTVEYIYKSIMGAHEMKVEEIEHGNYAPKHDECSLNIPNIALLGWYLDSDYQTEFDFSTPITESITLYAKQPNECTVTFLYFDGPNSNRIRTESVEFGYPIPEIIPEEEPFEFVGWFAEDTFENEWDFDSDFATKDVTLYAKWTVKQYTVTFDSNDGSIVPSQTINYGDMAWCPTAPNKEGYIFKGWYTNNDIFHTEWDFENYAVTNDITLYAKWEPKVYTVTYCYVSTPGIGATKVEEIVHGDYAPEHDEYSLNTPNIEILGWNLVDYYNPSVFDFSTPITKNIVLSADWIEKQFTVTFDSNDGSIVPNQTINYADTVIEPTAPTRTGYEFKGWYTDNDSFQNKWVFDTDLVTEDITLYAKWEIIKYTVTFDSNYGSTVSNQEIVEGGKVAKPADPVKDNYVFKGWYVDSNRVTPWNFDTDIVTENITLYAKWVSAFTVTFSNTGNSSVASQVVGYGDYAEEPTEPTKSYYEFAGWFTDMEYTTEWDFANDKVTEDITLYAKWNPGKCEVYFNEGLYADRVVDNQDVTVNELATNPGDLVSTNDEYVFVGWYITDNTKWDFETDIVTCDMSLEAKWVHKSTTYTVKFVPINRFELDWFSIPDQIVNAGDYATKPVTPSKSIEFWFCSDNYYTEYAKVKMFDFETTPIVGNITLYYDSSGGQQIKFYNMNDTTLEYEVIDSYYVKPNTKLERPVDPISAIGEFVGWCDINPSDLSGGILNPIYANHIWDFNTPITNPTQLYAAYAMKCNITFNSNGGSEVNTQSILENSLIIEPSTPTKKHYVFKGWYKDNTLETEWDFANDRVRTHTILYAKWEIEKHTFTFESNGGSAIVAQNVDYNTLATEPTVPSKDCYEFRGWFKDSACTVEWVFDTDLVTEDTVVYAKWVGRLEHQKDLEQETSIDFTWNDTVEDVQDAMKDEADTAYNETNNYWTAKMNVVPTNVTTLESTFSELQDAADTYEYAVAFDITLEKFISTDAELKDIIESKSINETKKPLVISFSAPELPTKKAIDEYSFYRVHNGAIEEIPVDYDRESNVFTFESDKFSEFAFYYEIADVYTVTFDSAGGSVVESQDVIDGHKATEPTAPTRDGFEFKGWFFDSALTQEYDFNTIVSSDIELIAKWKKEVTTPNQPEPSVEPTAEPTVEPGTPEPESNVEPSVSPIPTVVPTATPTATPIASATPIIKEEKKNTEEEAYDSDYEYVPESTPINDSVVEDIVEVETNGRVYTYVRTTEYGRLVDNKELKAFDISRFM